MLSSAAKRMKLEGIKLSEISQAQKDKYDIFSHLKALENVISK